MATRSDAASAVPPSPPAGSRLPLHRRIGRRGLRSLRPLFAPLLHRLDARVRWAVDRSEPADLLRRLVERTEWLAATLDVVRAEAAERHAAGETARLAATLDAVRAEAAERHAAGETARLAATLDAVRTEATQRETGQLATLNRLAAELESLDLRVAALRLGVTAIANATASLPAQTAALEAGVAAIANATASLPAQTAAVEAREQRLDGRLTETGGLWLQAAARLETRSDLLVQLAELLLQRNVIPLGQDFAVRTEAGYLLVPAEDLGLLVAAVETRGRLEPGSLGVLLSLLRENDTLIDVGANIGTFTLPAARRVGERGRVLALEPTPRIAALLRQTVALNGMSAQVDVRECAASDTEATARFGLSAQTTHNSLLPSDETLETIDIAVQPLDALVAPGDRVAAVKIDAEGAELQVWRGMQRIVSENPEMVVILEFGPEHLRRAGVTIAAWFAELTAAGHTAWEIDEAAAAVRALRTDGLGDIFSLNILLLRDPPNNRGLRMA